MLDFFAMYVVQKPYSIFNADVEINTILESNKSVEQKLKEILKIVKNYKISVTTKNKLLKFLRSIDRRKYKREILEILKNIKLKTEAFA